MSERPGQSRALIAALLGDDGVASEGAAARLAILGRPAVRNLLLALKEASATEAVRLLSVLERIADPLALSALAAAINDERGDVAEAAVPALAALLDSSTSTAATHALDHLTATALDASRPRGVRRAALDALTSLDLEVVALVRAQLLSDPDEAVRQAAGGTTGQLDPHALEDADDAPSSALAVIDAAANGRLPSEPETLRHALATGQDVSLTDLHRVIQHLRQEEARAPETAAPWRVARAAAHQALAARQSRLAVYDLRETVAQLGAATPVGVLSALHAIGDASTLEAITDAWVGSADAWFRGQLAGIVAAIVQREGLTRRHGVIRKLTQRAPDAVAALWPARQ